MRILITLCARGGSKGIPRKNIKLLNGKPLIYYTIELAKQFQKCFKNVEIILSSDSEKIENVAKKYGLVSNYRRPKNLASDRAGKVDVIKDVLLWIEDAKDCRFDYILDLDITSPLRSLKDLVEAFELIKQNKDANNLFSVTPASRNPYFNMVEPKENGFYNLVKQPADTILTRQSAPEVYDVNASFYIYKRFFFDKGFKTAITDKTIVYVVPHTCFDLDSPIDFEIMSYLLKNNKLDFEL